eukprot:SAG11_NODE_35741_length_265_cov_0.626506_2_plen_26_part_01
MAMVDEWYSLHGVTGQSTGTHGRVRM